MVPFERPAATRAHPRVCGADKGSRWCFMRRMGSSPRVRGRPVVGRRQVQHGGLIPAGAGQTTSLGLISPFTWAHPRGCGADVAVVGDEAAEAGSSPRVRGRRADIVGVAVVVGLIPAGAGQTSATLRVLVPVTAHPRGCGADRVMVSLNGVGQGSSRRVRGRHVGHEVADLALGLIPAGAGQTCARSASGRVCRAHPRGCGADMSRASASCCGVGSSPRVRGRPYGQLREHRQPRLIPAGAGQTAHHTPALLHPGAHPRGCGADPVAQVGNLHVQGSSPRVRGRPGRSCIGWCRPGLIPAGAGQTAPEGTVVSSPGAHPRGCGADLSAINDAPHKRGSSPRVRGRR